MTNNLRRNAGRTMRMTTIYILVSGVAMIIIFPMFFLFSFSLMSDYETYSEWPKPLLPRTSVDYRMDHSGNGNFRLSIWNVSENDWMPFGPEELNRNPDEIKKLSRFLNNYGNTQFSEEEILTAMKLTDQDGFYEFALRKSLIHNYRRFFKLYSGAARSEL